YHTSYSVVTIIPRKRLKKAFVSKPVTCRKLPERMGFLFPVTILPISYPIIMAYITILIKIPEYSRFPSQTSDLIMSEHIIHRIISKHIRKILIQVITTPMVNITNPINIFYINELGFFFIRVVFILIKIL